MKKKSFIFALLLFFHLTLSAFDVRVKVYLEGPFQGNSMTTLLGSELKKKFPHISNDVVDIVEVELRTHLASQAVETQQAFLLKDGTVVDFTTLQPTLHFQATGSAYHIVVKHRNHLPIASKHSIAHQALCDLTNAQNVWGEVYTVQQQAVMVAGNVHNEPGDWNEINASDFFKVSQAVDAQASGYALEDLNLDGIVNDKDLIIIKRNSEKLYYTQIQ